jgi:hypothetical protein
MVKGWPEVDLNHLLLGHTKPGTCLLSISPTAGKWILQLYEMPEDFALLLKACRDEPENVERVFRAFRSRPVG